MCRRGTEGSILSGKSNMEENNYNEKHVDADEPSMVKYRGVKAMPFVIGNETFEKLGTIGTGANLLVYLTTVFNMSSITATNLYNIYNGSANLATLLGAYLCDTYFGRYKTLGFACVASLMGMLAIMLTAAIPHLHPAACGREQTDSTCRGPTPGQLVFLLSGLVLLVIGGGGIRPCNLAFGADQFDPKTESGKKGVSSFFNWYYFTFTFAMMISLTFIVYVQSNVSWALGLGIPAGLMFLSCVLFFMGTKIYVKVEPEGSPLASFVQVLVAAVRKRHMILSQQTTLFNYIPKRSINSQLLHTKQFRCLDRGAIITTEDIINPDGSAANPWKLCTRQQIEEAKCIIRVIPIWISGVFYAITTATQHNYAVFQALQSDRHIGMGKFEIPAASYIVFIMIALTAWIPFYDRIIVPALRRVTNKEGGITVLQKIGVGILLAILSLVISAVVEKQRRTMALVRPMLGVEAQRGAVSSLSGMWLAPQLALTGLSEGFGIIGLVEFFYSQFPENMRSIGGSFLCCVMAIASYLTSLLASIVHKMSGNWLASDLNEGKLDYFYYLIAGMESVNLLYFLVCSKWYKYRGTADGGGNSSLVDTSIEEKHENV